MNSSVHLKSDFSFIKAIQIGPIGSHKPWLAKLVDRNIRKLVDFRIITGQIRPKFIIKINLQSLFHLQSFHHILFRTTSIHIHPTLTLLMSAGILSQKFVNIEKLNHRFPQELKGLNRPVTLLHNHPHSPTGFVLVYEKDFSKSTYMATEKALASYYPCSWFLEGGVLCCYEYCDEPLEYDLEQTAEWLETLEKMGYKHYGTTVRPIRNTNQVETKTGHLYVDLPKTESPFSETAMDGRQVDACYSRCFRTFMQAHYAEHVED